MDHRPAGQHDDQDDDEEPGPWIWWWMFGGLICIDIWLVNLLLAWVGWWPP